MRKQNQTFTPLKLKPLALTPTNHKFTGMSFGGLGATSGRILPDASNQPDPTPEQIQHFEEHGKKIIDQIVHKSLKKHKDKDALHGSKSLQLIIGKDKYPHEPADWDVFSKEEKKRALEIEKAIDDKAGADIAHTRYQTVRKVSMGPDDPYTGKHLYIVETPDVRSDNSVDYMDFPKDLPTLVKGGIRHEHLNIAYMKASTRYKRQIMKAQRGFEDARLIKEYYMRQGRKINTPKTQTL